MKIPELHEDRQYALKQWRAVHNLIHCKEQAISFYNKKIKELEEQLALVSKDEVDALYAENERLTEYIEELENKLK